MVTPAGFEPTTPGLGILCSILLSYGTSRPFPYTTRVNDLQNLGFAGLSANR